MGKALGSKNLMVAFFICNPHRLHGRSYEKSRKMSRDRTVDLKNDCNRNRECLESWVPSKRSLKDAKNATSSSKSATHGRPHNSDDTLGVSFSSALAVMPCALGPYGFIGEGQVAADRAADTAHGKNEEVGMDEPVCSTVGRTI